VDFTAMTNAEIISHINGRNNICGRFENGQLAALNQQFQHNQPRFKLFRKIGFVAAVLAALPFAKVSAQGKHTTKAANGTGNRHNPILPKAKCDTTVSIAIVPSLLTTDLHSLGVDNNVRYSVVGGLAIGYTTGNRTLNRAWYKTKWIFGGNK